MLDEPFGALDAFTREELWDTLQSLWLQHGFTVILVTHDLREAVYLADTGLRHEQAPGPDPGTPGRTRCRTPAHPGNQLHQRLRRVWSTSCATRSRT
ncbi:MAG: hypothetical protein U5L06_02285 [Rhodovibrio sp.]|nr:hypothetical protein [Rhodovibrio sp.]